MSKKMTARQMSIPTEHASKYLQQLCKHFAHKVEASFDAYSGFAALPPGPCTMTANDNVLRIHCRAQDEEGLRIMESIIETHLVKFAWREDIKMQWQDCPHTNITKEVSHD
ncbi:MAG: DUF2218 domain-containing protein [Terasakiella sp.]|uniref:DUF2218 domain-containing protein n=2 Tax=Terasakiella TaxID=196080 RepID=UPI003B0013DB